MDTMTHATETAAGGDLAPAVYETRQTPALAAEADPFFAMIERAARDPAISVDKLERLFDLSERARQARARQAFAEAFAALQIELPTIDRKNRIIVYSKRDREKPGGPVEGVDTPQQATAYATLETIIAAIRAPLSKHGFSIRFEHATASGLIETTAVLTHRYGHAEKATTPPLQHDSSGSKNNVQAVGSSLTYGRRYALLALLALVSHAPQDADDDGRAAGSGTGDAITEDQAAEIRQMIAGTKSNEAKFLAAFKVDSVESLRPTQFEQARGLLMQKAAVLARKASEAAANAG